MSELEVVSVEEEAQLGGPGGKSDKKRQSERLDEAVREAKVELFHDAELRTYATFERDAHLERIEHLNRPDALSLQRGRKEPQLAQLVQHDAAHREE